MKNINKNIYDISYIFMRILILHLYIIKKIIFTIPTSTMSFYWMVHYRIFNYKKEILF